MPPKCYHFQRFGPLAFPHSLSDVLPDICGRLRGEGIVKASLQGTYCQFCERLTVSTVSRASSNTFTKFCKRLLKATLWKAPRATNTNTHGLQPINTKGCSSIGWKCLNGCLSTHGSVNISLCVCTGQVARNTSVRCKACDIMKHLTGFANIDIAPGPFATDI